MSECEFTITETSSMVDLEEYLNYLVMERCNEIYAKLIREDAEYKNLQAQIEGCFGELLNALPGPERQTVLNDTLWSIIGRLELLLPRITYKQAFKDGFGVKGKVNKG